MVNQLQLRGRSLQIGDGVLDGQPVGAGSGADDRPQAETRKKEGGFVHFSHHRNPAAPRIGTDLHVVSRQVGNLAVEGEVDRDAVPIVVDDDIFAGGSIGVQAATHDAFVETLQPAQPAPVPFIHPLGMHRAFDRRLPTHRNPAAGGFPQPHSPSRQDREGEFGIGDLHQIDSASQASLQLRLGDRAIRDSQVVVAQKERLLPNVCTDIRQNPRLFLWHGLSSPLMATSVF